MRRSHTIFFIAPIASAEEHYVRDGFWGGIDAGCQIISFAQVKFAYSSCGAFLSVYFLPSA